MTYESPAITGHNEMQSAPLHESTPLYILKYGKQRNLLLPMVKSPCCKADGNSRNALTLQVTRLASSRSEAQKHVCLPVRSAPWLVLLQHSIMLQLLYIVECGIACFLCGMRVFKVWASSSFPSLPLCQILFLSWLPLLS